MTTTKEVGIVRDGIPGAAPPGILFPTDFSEHAAAAWLYAVGLAREGGAELHVLHVVAPPVLGASPEGVVSLALVDEMPAEAKGVMAQLAASARTFGVATHIRTSLGDAAAEIVAYAADQRIGLIVMATTGRTGLAHVLLGSVAERVVRHATCPVLTVRYDGEATPVVLTRGTLPQLRRILVPLDGSELGEAVLPRVVKLAKRHRADLMLLRVTHAHALREVDLVDAQIRVVQTAEAYLAGVAGRLAAEGLDVLPVVRYGETAEEILDDIWTRRPNLVAMGTNGRTGLTHLVLGSVAERTLRSSPVPVLLFPTRTLSEAAAESHEALAV